MYYRSHPLHINIQKAILQKYADDSRLHNTKFYVDNGFSGTNFSDFIQLVRKYTHISVLTPEIMHELVEKIVVHAPDKSS